MAPFFRELVDTCMQEMQASALYFQNQINAGTPLDDAALNQEAREDFFDTLTWALRHYWDRISEPSPN